MGNLLAHSVRWIIIGIGEPRDTAPLVRPDIEEGEDMKDKMEKSIEPPRIAPGYDQMNGV